MNSSSLSALAAAWQTAKALEDSAKQQRLEVEAQIVAALPLDKPEGTASSEADGVRVKVSYKVDRKVDSDKLQAMWSSLSDKAQAAFRWEAEVRTKELKALQDLLPSVYAAIAPVIETKPCKPSIEITTITKE